MKLSQDIIKAMAQNKVSSTDVRIIMYICRIMQSNGCAYNVNSREVSNLLNINITTFYRRLKFLSNRGLISYVKIKNGYYNITLSYSDYTDGDSSYANYVNINYHPFGDEFNSLKATEMLTVLQLALRNRDCNGLHCSTKTIASYANISPKNRQVISRIVENIKNIKYKSKSLFTVRTYKNKKCQNVHQFFFSGKSHLGGFEKVARQRHMFTSFLKKNNYKYTNKDIDDLIQMDNQYKNWQAVYKSKIRESLDRLGILKCDYIRKSMIQEISFRGGISTHTDYEVLI